ncbi:MAG: hypothetical protein SNJ57_18285 [Cyanobacteriota bacterium]
MNRLNRAAVELQAVELQAMELQYDPVCGKQLTISVCLIPTDRFQALYKVLTLNWSMDLGMLSISFLNFEIIY